jgi:hypothetical protein
LTIAITIATATQTTIAPCIQIQLGDIGDHRTACDRHAASSR